MNNTIMFRLARSGELDTLPGSTEWSSLPAVFALDATYQRDAEYRATYATDAEGLRRAAKAAHSTAATIGDAMALIGKLLAAADHDFLSGHDYHTVGWLLNGLGDLQTDVLNAAWTMREALDDKDVESEGSENG